MNTTHWYAVHTKPRAEQQAQTALERKGVAVYLPMVKIARVNPRAKPLVPLFSRYLFVYVDLEGVGLSAINWTPGVSQLVTIGGIPAAVPEAAITHVKQRLNEVQSSGEFGLGPFRRGDRVRITQGPFRDLDAVFDEPSGKKRARVLLEFLGRLTACEVELEALEKAFKR